MYGCPCCNWAPGPAFEQNRRRGYRYGPPPWMRFWGSSCYGPTKSEHKEDLEALKKHLEEQLAEVTEELGKL